MCSGSDQATTQGEFSCVQYNAEAVTDMISVTELEREREGGNVHEYAWEAVHKYIMCLQGHTCVCVLCGT